MKTSKGRYERFPATFLNYIVPEKRETKNDSQYQKNRNNPIEQTEQASIQNIIKERFETIRFTLVDILYDIHCRSMLDYGLTERLNQEICNLRTQLLNIERWPVGSNMTIDRKRQNIENKIHDLEKELRTKDIRSWQDIRHLKTEFRKTFREYKEIKQKFMIVDGGK